jgi:GTP-binding protein Era
VQKHLPNWFSKNAKQTPETTDTVKQQEDTFSNDESNDKHQQKHLSLAKESLKKLLEDKRVPETIRAGLNNDFQQLQSMLDKLEQGHIHIAVFGRVSVGKSSLLNALIGKEHFSVSLLHGETKQVDMSQWNEYADGNIYLLDTPGINEISGEEREQMAHDAASRADLLLFVVDSDLTESEISALKMVASTQRPIILVVNKADQYTEKEQLELRSIIRDRTKNIVAPENIVFTTAQSIQQNVIYVDDDGNEHESVRTKPKDVTQLKARLWDIMEAEGQTLAALNASLFAGQISNDVAQRILATRKEIGRKLIHYYCLGKGVAVALNPIPVADLFAAAAVDAGMITHLSKVYGLPMTRHETGELVKTIIAQLLLLLGTTWATHFISSALKLGTGGLSTLITAATQGAVAWYSTLVVGKVAEAWLANGKSWGDAGPKLTVQNILDNLDRDSVVSEAKEEILKYIKSK